MLGSRVPKEGEGSRAGGSGGAARLVDDWSLLKAEKGMAD